MPAEPARNGIRAADLGDDGWTKPRSDNGGDRPEANKLPGGRVALRQSAGPRSPALVPDPDEIRALAPGAKAGPADDLIT